MTNVATLHLEELKKELEEYKELSANRLTEIEKLNEEKAQAMNEIDKLKIDVMQCLINQISFSLIEIISDSSPSRIYHH